MRRCIIGVTLLTLVAMMAGRTQPAEAHPLPKGTSVKIGLHRICGIWPACRDVPPKPKINCWWGIREKREEIYDPTLDALVTWRCSCPWGEHGKCMWVRVSIRPVPPDWMIPTNKHVVWDWQRRCAALVCLKTRVEHLYYSLRFYPNTR